MTTELIWTNDKERGFQLVEIVREEEEGIIIRSSPKSMRSDDKVTINITKYRKIYLLI